MKLLLLTLYSCLLLSSYGALQNLPPGGFVDTNGTTSAASPELGGEVIHDHLIPFEVRHTSNESVLLTGFLQDRVVRNGQGNLVFSPRIRGLFNPNGEAWISNVRYNGFEGLSLGVEYRTDGLGQVGPSSISRSADGDQLTAHHSGSFILAPDEQRFLTFSSTETEYDLAGRVEIFVNNDFGGGVHKATIHGTASRKSTPVDFPTAEEIRPTLPKVILNDVIYQDGQAVTAEVHFTDISQIDPKRLVLVFGGSEGAGANSQAELEMVKLVSTQDPLVYVTDTALQILDSDQPVQRDGKISLEQGELFVAMLSYEYHSPQKTSYDLFSSDWGSLLVDEPSIAKVALREGLALTDDELNPVDGGKPMGTLFVEGSVGAVQVASKEILFFPKDDAQLTEFLARTNGVISGFEGHPGGEVTPATKLPKAGEAWFVISMQGDPKKIPQLPQLRALVGEQSTLSVSNQETRALLASAMELWSEGFLVGLNPRMQMHGSLEAPEHQFVSGRADAYGLVGDNSANSLPIQDGRHGMRQCWAFLAMFDYAERAIPVGIIDSGFATNPDFKIDHPLYSERNLSNDTSGPGSAQTPQEVGNSGFGDKKWHGNATLTTISGVLGNRYGTAGVAAQTAVPKLYHMGLRNFALGFGSAIQIAVDDGCSVINISAGYPCRILSTLGNDDICSAGGRAAFAAKLSLAVRVTALAVCAASPLLDLFLPGAGAAACASAVTAAEVTAAALFSSIFLGDTRGPVERGVAYATSRGVPIVASAGNRLSADTVGIIAPFINLEESNIDQWQMIPAVIPEVIAVGACFPTDENRWNGFERNFYANLHFWGDSVDIWAPIYHQYWAPLDGEVDPSTVPLNLFARRTFGGTSCAAPVITGVIANMMAVDPSLDRRLSPPATHAGLPQRIRNLLVTHAYQAGDPEAPNSADDRVLRQWNTDTESFYVIDMPASLVTELKRRRNYVNPWRTLRELARSRGLLEYEELGYNADLGRRDRYADTSTPGGVAVLTLENSDSILDELGDEDVEFFNRRTPSSEGYLYRAHFTATIPLRENRDNFRINGTRGSLVSMTADEQTLSWVSSEYWDRISIPTTISGSDTLYKIDTRVTSRTRPPADRFDTEGNSNDSIETAVPQRDWVKVDDTIGFESEAWELCVDDLNINLREDRDFFRIDFPSELGVPVRCTGFDPWITVSITPPTSGTTIRVYSGAGGERDVIKTGPGTFGVKLDCREYLRKLPLFVEVVSASYLEYALKVRWSKPSEVLVDIGRGLREANANGRTVSEIEELLPPIVPQLIGMHGEFGAIPDEVVNPNPAAQQPLDSAGRFLFARLIEVNVLRLDRLTGILAQIQTGQSLRLQLYDTSGKLLFETGTADHGFSVDSKAISGSIHSLSLELPNMPVGSYILSLSGHRAGDQITLFPSRSLLGDVSGISMEDVLGGTLGGVPANLPHLTEFGSDARFTSLRPAYHSGVLDLRRAPSVDFMAEKGEIYQVQLQGDDDVWRPYESPVLGDGDEVSFVIDALEKYENVRVVRLGSEEKVPMTWGAASSQLLYQTIAGVPAGLYWSPNLKEGSWERLGDEPSEVGDGSLRNWFLEFGDGSEKRFFRIEEE